MPKIIKLPIILNKRNGQINSYFKSKQLPKKVVEEIKKQPESLKKILLEFRGYE